MDAMKLINNLCEGYNAAADEPAMQELKPLPCPLCGSKEPKVNRGCGVVTCCEISVEDVAAWNKLPRALTWTHEPPKVAGWYWYQLDGHAAEPRKIDSSFDGEEYLGVRDGWYVNRITKKPHVKWAGPIPAPID